MSQSYSNAIPLLANPSNFNGMDASTWSTQTAKYRFGTFIVQETAKTIDRQTLETAGTNINAIVNGVAQTALNQVTTQLVNGCLQAGANVNIVGINVDAGYSATPGFLNVAGHPIPTTFYTVWWAAYIVYDSDTDLTQIMLPEPSNTTGLGSFQLIGLIVLVAILVVIAIIAYFAIQALESWLKSMTTTTNTTTTLNKITNPTNQPITVQTPNGPVTIPPGGTYQWSTTSTTTSPNLGGIITVGAVAIGLAGVGIFSYAFLKGLQKPK
jgi:hypothetical protein